MRRSRVFLLSLLILLGMACSDPPPGNTFGDDDATGPDDDATGPDDDATGPDDDATGPDDDATGPDDDATGSDDDATGSDDDTTGSDDDATASDDDATAPSDDDTFPCIPWSCDDVDANCGSTSDGCGGTLECGGCPPWQGCGLGGSPNQCGSSGMCIPEEEWLDEGGGRCGDLDQAWTGRGINVGYYPFRVLAPIEQYSGDYTGEPGEVFEAGDYLKGVILQVIPAGAYVALSSIGPYYNPSGECLTDAETCGDPEREACTDSSPPLRLGNHGFYWGYAYSGASHMQGWIYADAARLEFAGFDSSHPCATGPAGLDFEVATACGAATTCSGTNRTCGEANPCSEGADDCGREECGAATGGSLTPSAHTFTVGYPDEAVTCTESDPPHDSVKCLPNGDEVDFFYVYPHGAYLYWAQNSTTKGWLHYGDAVQSYFHTRDAQDVLWDFVEVLSSGTPILQPASDGSGADEDCSAENPDGCDPCRSGGTCGWIQEVFLE